MKIGIIGSGEVAKTLAAGFLKHGHEVTLGTREAGKLSDFATANPKAKIGRFADAAKFGEVVVLAVKGAVAAKALEAAGAENLAGKTVIDATNPLADAPPENGVLKYFTNLDSSLMEQLQKQFAEAHFVKAFNSGGRRPWSIRSSRVASLRCLSLEQRGRKKDGGRNSRSVRLGS